jgi:hypothetical protein
MGRGSRLLTLLKRAGGGSIYDYAVFVDDFTVDASAGEVNGTTSSDGLAKRSVVDTESKLSVSGGGLQFSGKASPAWGDPYIRYTTLADGPFSVGLGSALLVELSATNAVTGYSTWGLDENATGADLVPDTRIQFGSGGGLLQVSSTDGQDYPLALVNNTDFKIMLLAVGESAGYDVLHYTGSGALWDRIGSYSDSIANSGSLAPAFMVWNLSGAITRVALLDLSPLMAGALGDSEETPVSIPMSLAVKRSMFSLDWLCEQIYFPCEDIYTPCEDMG